MTKKQEPPGGAAPPRPRTGEYQAIHVDAIDPSPLNRKYAEDDQRVLSLAAELAEQGLLHPINVRVMPGDRYEIICGEGRWRAFRHNGRKYIPALIHECDESAAQIMRLSENIHRNDLEPLEEGEGVAALLRLHDGNFKEVSARVGWSEAWVRRRAGLVNLSPAWRGEIADPETRYPHIRDKVMHLEEIASLPRETQDSLLSGGTLEWKRTATDLRRAIAMAMRRLDAKPWSYEFDKKTYSGSCGRRCESCTKRTSKKDGGLFDSLLDASAEVAESDRKSDLCLDPACWEEKTVSFIKAQIAANPGICLLAGDHTYDAKLNEVYGRSIFSSWEYAERVEGKRILPAFDLEARGIFIAGSRIGKIVDVMLRGDAADRADDASRAERLENSRMERERGAAHSKAIRDAIEEALPKNVPEELPLETLMRFGLWFGLDCHSHDDDPVEYHAWDIRQMAWESIRGDAVTALELFLPEDPGDACLDDGNRSACMKQFADALHFSFQQVEARAEELLAAGAD